MCQDCKHLFMQDDKDVKDASGDHVPVWCVVDGILREL